MNPGSFSYPQHMIANLGQTLHHPRLGGPALDELAIWALVNIIY